MTSNGPRHSISYKTTFPLSNDSDQPVQMRRLIRVIALLLLAKHPSFHLDERQWSCLECVYAQDDLSLRLAHVQYCGKCCAPAEISENVLAGFIFIVTG